MNTLDPEAEEALQSVENEEWREIENFAGEKQRHADIARYPIARMEIERLLSAEDWQKVRKSPVNSIFPFPVSRETSRVNT
ncbi:hypothetical protein V0288_15480 [Pannus brasiliensis CCIBt3594]|uniref:Uncharacterized protein n=1 Tax=Pannus brasiliensis CCIBt3594 TaxID=1427578 RepID=A0AAW9QWF1_9CHRO